jgi:hypothetical protein
MEHEGCELKITESSWEVQLYIFYVGTVFIFATTEFEMAIIKL